MQALAIAGLGTTELLLILAVIILLFGAAKLPDLARGSGRALRIFKAETKGLTDDDDDNLTPEQREINRLNSQSTLSEGEKRPGEASGTDRP